MATFNEANQVRSSLKMRLSLFSWYCGSKVLSEQNGYFVVVNSKKINGFVRRQVPTKLKEVSIKIELD